MTKSRKSPSKIFEEIQRKDHLHWTEEECTEALFVLEKAKSVCLEILTDILPNETCGRAHFEKQLVEIEANIQICQQILPHKMLTAEEAFKENWQDFEKALKALIMGYFGFWVVLIIIALLYD